MRSREDILGDTYQIEQTSCTSEGNYREWNVLEDREALRRAVDLILEVLLDIRDSLQEKSHE